MAYLAVNGTNLFYQSRGSGPLALFVPAFLLDHTLWLDQIEALADVRQCVALDLRGFGRSDPVVLSRLDLEQYVSDLAAVIQALDAGPADVVGLSLGGYLAALLWEAHPQLVRSLTLASALLEADTPETSRYRAEMAALAVREGVDVLYRRWIEYIVAPNASLMARARYHSMLAKNRYEMIVSTMLGMPERRDRTDLLAKVSVPTLVLTSDGDTIIPQAHAEAMAAGIRLGQCRVIEGAGRLMPIENPVAVSDALRAFWS
jgi:pimeloyl-ACP methyl ester carboxylesterase